MIAHRPAIASTVTLNGDTGAIVQLWPDGRYALVDWQPGPSDIAGRVLWCPTVWLETDEPTPTIATAHMAMKLGE